MMVEVGSMPIMKVLANATNTIAKGEVQQLLNRHNPETTENDCLKVIHNKTAKLFEAAAQIGAIISNSPSEQEQTIATYGKHLGISYQLIDDVLDYSASTSELGKNIGDDLAEGKPTLPLLYAMWNGSKSQSNTVRNAIENGGLENINDIMQAIESTGAIAYTAKLARQEADKAIKAISNLPASEYLEALYALAHFAIERTH